MKRKQWLLAFATGVTMFQLSCIRDLARIFGASFL